MPGQVVSTLVSQCTEARLRLALCTEARLRLAHISDAVDVGAGAELKLTFASLLPPRLPLKLEVSESLSIRAASEARPWPKIFSRRWEAQGLKASGPECG